MYWWIHYKCKEVITEKQGGRMYRLKNGITPKVITDVSFMVFLDDV